MRKLNIPKPDFIINPDTFLFLIGSCFSDSISKYFLKQGINCISNPFGTIYNPISIVKILEDIITQKRYSANDFVLDKGMYHSLQHANIFQSQSAEVLSEMIESIQNNVYENLLIDNSVVIITLGTALVYEYDNSVIGNCHTLNRSNFTNRLLSLNEVVCNIIHSIVLLESINPTIKVVFTVSPIRLPDNIILNSRSKSLLLLGIEEALSKCDFFYFPSYEIVIDQLSDYSYYKSDLVHLNKKATRFIYKRFSETFFSSNMFEYINSFSEIRKMLKHRSKNPISPATYSLLKNNIKNISILREKYIVIPKDIEHSLALRLIIFFNDKEDFAAHLSLLFSSNIPLEIQEIINFISSMKTVFEASAACDNKLLKEALEIMFQIKNI